MEKKKAKKTISEEIEIEEGVQASLENRKITIKGEKGEISRELNHPMMDIKLENNKVTITSKKSTKKEKKIVNTFIAHINNMVKGAKEGHIYLLKICSGHFPMTVTAQNNELQIKNFFGEQKPRILKLKPGAEVKVEGEIIKVESADLELAGTIASKIEALASRFGFDKRVFQDGIYIIEKNGKKV